VLTDTKLKALLATPPARRTELVDGTISGLMLRAGPRGKPTWTLRYAITGRGGVTARGKSLAGRKFYRIQHRRIPKRFDQGGASKSERDAFGSGQRQGSDPTP